MKYLCSAIIGFGVVCGVLQQVLGHTTASVIGLCIAVTALWVRQLVVEHKTLAEKEEK